MLAKTLGVRILVVVINKMDDPTVEWSEERFAECRDKLTPFLKGCGYNVKKDVVFVPLSALAAGRALAPTYSQMHLNHGLTLKQERRYDEAATAFGEAVRLDPLEAHDALGHVTFARKRSSNWRGWEVLMHDTQKVWRAGQGGRSWDPLYGLAALVDVWPAASLGPAAGWRLPAWAERLRGHRTRRVQHAIGMRASSSTDRPRSFSSLVSMPTLAYRGSV